MMKRDVIKSIAFNVLVFIIIFFLSSLTQLKGDDLRIQEYSNSDLHTTCIQAFKYSNDTYLTWHGRWWVTFASVVLALQNKTIYNVLNSLFFVWLINLLVFGFTKDLNDKRRKRTIYAYLLSFGMMWIFIPSVWDVYLWLSGSIGYLWTTTILLLYGTHWYNRFLVLKCNNVQDFRCKHINTTSKLVRCAVLSVGGFFAGFSQEPGACALVLALMLYVVYVRIRKEKVPWWEWVGILFTILGVALLILAPGNQIRIENVQSYVASENAGIIVKYGTRIAREMYYFLLYLCIPIGVYVFLLLLNRKDEDKLAKHFINNSDSCVLVVVAIASVFVLTFSAGFATRIFLFPLALITSACVREFSKIDNKKLIYAVNCLIVSMMFFCLMSIAFAVKEYHTNGNRIERNMYTDDFYGNPELENGND